MRAECKALSATRRVTAPSTPDPYLLVRLVTDGTSKGEAWAEGQRHRGRVGPAAGPGAVNPAGLLAEDPAPALVLRLFVQNSPQPQSRANRDVAAPPFQAAKDTARSGWLPRKSSPSQQRGSPAMSAKPPAPGRQPPGLSRAATRLSSGACGVAAGPVCARHRGLGIASLLRDTALASAALVPPRIKSEFFRPSLLQGVTTGSRSET